MTEDKTEPETTPEAEPQAEPDPAPAEDPKPKAKAKAKGPKHPTDPWLLFTKGGKMEAHGSKADAIEAAEAAGEAGKDSSLYVRIR